MKQFEFGILMQENLIVQRMSNHKI